MYNLLIIDDEPLVRLALRNMIDWYSLGITIAAEASDGTDAFALLRDHGDIDILLLDIEMPRMNGIELLRAINEDVSVNRKPVSIVLSAYHQYSYVREAFLLGATDYIVKADMDADHILPVIRQVLEQLAEIRSKHRQEKPIPPWETEGWIKQLIEGHADPAYPPDSGWETQVLVCVFQTAESAQDDKIGQYVTQTLENVLATSVSRHSVGVTGKGEYTVLCTFPQERSESAIRDKIYGVLSSSLTRLEQYMNVKVSIGVSGLRSGLKHVASQYEQAKHSARMAYFRGFGKILFPEPSDPQRLEQESGLQAQLKQIRAEIVSTLQRSDENNWKEPFHSLRMILRDIKHGDPAVYQDFFTDFMWELGSLLYIKGRRWPDIGEGYEHPKESVDGHQTMEESLSWLEQCLCKLQRVLHRQDLQLKRFSEPIANAKRFIDEHFREDVSQSLISQMVGVSESYLSKQFAKEVGCNFIQYVTKLRMEEAKQLLEKGVKITTVSERVGYLNPEHFSRIFKKFTGVNPKTYREAERN